MTWRQDLPFSVRVAAIAAIAQAYQAAHSGAAASEARDYAKAREKNLREQAASQIEYDQLVADVKVSLAVELQSSQEPERERNLSGPLDGGITIGAYENAQHYKDGTSSEVFVATRAGGLFALKIAISTTPLPPHDVEREARILKTLKAGHNIIELLETFSDQHNRLVLVFPLQRYDLSTLLKHDELPRHARKTVMRDVFRGLAYVHTQGIIHRDVKPSNILLAFPTGPAYLADFGIAWSATDKASEPAEQKILDVGTTCYRPPELLFGGSAYDTSLDQWAAGCVAAQVLCLGRETLFDAGELGSELALIKSIFQTLGTPDLESWPGAAHLPDWGKMNFVKYSRRDWQDILPACGYEDRALISGLITYESSQRLTADQALHHEALQG